MATSPRTRRPVSSDTSATVIATPAEGPSFDTAPAGRAGGCPTFSKSVVMPSSSTWVRTHDRPARADSFITSPSWPVRIRFPLPAIAEASMKRMSPPVGIQARPVATPGISVRSATSE